MDLVCGGRGIFVHEQTTKFAQSLQSRRLPTRENPRSSQCVQVSPRIELSITISKLGKLEPERSKIGDVVVELVDASLYSLDLVQLERIVGLVRNREADQLEILAELSHRNS